MVVAILFFFSFVTSVACEMQGFIVGGDFAKIEDLPHSVYICVVCHKGYETSRWVCGGSIINQRLVLTAAHCVYKCSYESHIAINVGSEHKSGGFATSSHSYLIHEDYVAKTSRSDIGLIKTNAQLPFSGKSARVALTNNPPATDDAIVAGWGLVEKNGMFVATDWLMELKVKVIKAKVCSKQINIPKGTICASSKWPNKYPAQGDSGSALVVNGYIQIGLVSYKVPSISENMVVYTDTAYYYDWIEHQTKRLYCA